MSCTSADNSGDALICVKRCNSLSSVIEQVSKLINYYSKVVQAEKAEREQRKLFQRRARLSLGLAETKLARLGGRRSSLGTKSTSTPKRNFKSVAVDVEDVASKASENVEPLSDDFYTKPVDISETTTLRQRFQQPLSQPRLVNDLLPRKAHLTARYSMRCRECEHNLSKPDFNPSLTRFKIQLIAMHYVPHLRVARLPPLCYNQEETVIMSLYNPLQHAVPIQLELSSAEEERIPQATAEVTLPDSELIVAAKEDAIDYGDIEPTQYDDDPKIIHFRKANRLQFYIKVKPLKAVGNVQFSCHMKYDYHSKTSLALRSSSHDQPEMVPLDLCVDINLGLVSLPKPTVDNVSLE
ncbi:dynactin subunit 4-like [Corticium candelabrum]|uniref:dynactin subunit 4-like n=1 Tax=Corticium candelabrum TaxID=121492 RepID=UPI002E26E963|nr:dynactin subunit 4-like [Corticium candelabrum]